ncbi:MAG: DNA mismatch repair protein MutS [Bacteroidetes bacterium]|nr:DNA mismatch repair protein MutS [Bacteroidota bacterium]
MADIETPLMKQYNSVKQKHPGAIVLFRVGDFYETFGEDAVTASKILGITLTRRNNGKAGEIELAGFPYHALDVYLPRLVKAGQRVAVCDQLEDPKLAKTIVKRGVTEIVTPGVCINDKILESKQNNFLASLYNDGTQLGVSFIDISTGEFYLAQGDFEYISKLMQNLKPTEVIYPKSYKQKFESHFSSFYSFPLDDWVFETNFSKEKLLSHFKTSTLKGFGVDDLSCGIAASGAILHYLNQNQINNISHVQSISRIDKNDHVWLDHFSIRNLELITSSNPMGKSLLDILDYTHTPMGARLLKKWIVMPLPHKKQIENRLNVVDFFIKNNELRTTVSSKLSRLGDLERLNAKVSLNRINPRELIVLSKALETINEIKQLITNAENEELKVIADKLNPCEVLVNKIANSIKNEPPLLINKGDIFKSNYNDELDSLRKIAFSGKDFLINIQKTESERTGIPNLKISFNNVFGYFLEVTNSHKNKVPTDWIRKQTLTNAERYITQELKEYEEKIVNAEEKIGILEFALYKDFVEFTANFFNEIKINSQQLAKLDCLVNFSEISLQNNYNKPEINESKALTLLACRHPVLEKQLQNGEEYIPNDIHLNDNENQIIILTGPNMSGKSAILRQTAICVLMAQMGCFVPAKHAEIGIVDKIYTRVGASDNISQGESTFMVEMIETASILNNLSNRSLIILDEIGRGTSTFDGVSLAWAIAEFLNQHPTKPKTLFATHYHELNELEAKNKGIVNFHISTKETTSRVLFLRKLERGGSEHSFGIHVAKMAGIPSKIVSRASTILEQLEKDRAMVTGRETSKKIGKHDYQLNLFQYNNPEIEKIVKELKILDTNSLTPIEALLKLNELKNVVSKK